MDLRAILDLLALAKAEDVLANAEAIQNAISRFDVDSGVDRLMFINGQGHLIGLPTRPGFTSTATTGVPTNSVAGYAKSALFFNFLGGVGTFLYVNIGSQTSSTWLNIA